MNLNNYVTVIKEIAVQAGEKIMEFYQTDFDNSIEIKADNSPLTIADKAANEIIVKKLSQNFPKFAILSEENKNDSSRLNNDWCWIVDPLDGTKEFIKKNDEFTVNIALAYQQKIVLGVIYVPVTETLFYATKGTGAFKEVKGSKTKINVSDKTTNLNFVGSKSHSGEKEQQLLAKKANLIKGILSAGSSLKGTMVAEGIADVYYRFGYTCEWDTAAMQCIIEEAGGIFRQLDNTEMVYNRENNLNEKGFYIVNNQNNIWV